MKARFTITKQALTEFPAAHKEASPLIVEEYGVKDKALSDSIKKAQIAEDWFDYEQATSPWSEMSSSHDGKRISGFPSQWCMEIKVNLIYGKG